MDLAARVAADAASAALVVVDNMGGDLGSVADAITLLGAPGLVAMPAALPLVAASPTRIPVGAPIGGSGGTLHGHHGTGSEVIDVEEDDPFIANLEKIYAQKSSSEVGKRMRILTAKLKTDMEALSHTMARLTKLGNEAKTLAAGYIRKNRGKFSVPFECTSNNAIFAQCDQTFLPITSTEDNLSRITIPGKWYHIVYGFTCDGETL